jgi:hypothetical protein
VNNYNSQSPIEIKKIKNKNKSNAAIRKGDGSNNLRSSEDTSDPSEKSQGRKRTRIMNAEIK